MLKENSSLFLGKSSKNYRKTALFWLFDYGLARIGVAIGNTVVKDSRPLTIIHWKKKPRKVEANYADHGGIGSRRWWSSVSLAIRTAHLTQ